MSQEQKTNQGGATPKRPATRILNFSYQSEAYFFTHLHQGNVAVQVKGGAVGFGLGPVGPVLYVDAFVVFQFLLWDVEAVYIVDGFPGQLVQLGHVFGNGVNPAEKGATVKRAV